MILIKSNLWTSGAEIIAVTTNSHIISNKLVMGAGAAAQAKERYPTLPFLAGAQIKHLEVYGFLVFEINDHKIGIFQTKKDFRYPSTLELINFSVTRMFEYLGENPDTTIALNYPGIGYGQLKRSEVEPLLMKLPDTVHIYHR